MIVSELLVLAVRDVKIKSDDGPDVNLKRNIQERTGNGRGGDNNW